MRISIDIPDADVAACSTQFESRTPIARDPVTKAIVETAAAHVTRAVQAWASQELRAARTLALAAEVARLEADPDATVKQREDAALAEWRARRA